jgi:GNAT superfamily N-acetyltransferase
MGNSPAVALVGSRELQRLTFAPDRLAEVVRFCAQEGCRFEAPLVERLLLRTTRSAEGVFLLASARTGELALVAAVVEVGTSSQGAAILEVLAARPGWEGPDLARHLLEPAIAWARGGGRKALEMAATGVFGDLRDLLTSAGFSLAHEEVRMERPADARCPDASPDLPPGFTWDVLDSARARETHAALAEIFAATPLFFLSPLAVFEEAIASCSVMGRLLLEDGGVAGVVQWVPGDPVVLRTVGLRPRYRGRGLGAALMKQALREPSVVGRKVSLETEGQNHAALALYAGFEFRICERIPWLRLVLG